LPVDAVAVELVGEIGVDIGVHRRGERDRPSNNRE
jgi:hypothetical protein